MARVKINKEFQEKCFNFGKIAFENEKKCVPAWDKNLESIIIELDKLGESCVPYLKAWQHGWMDANLKAPVK